MTSEREPSAQAIKCEHAEQVGTRWRDRLARLLGPYCVVCLRDWPCP